MSEIRKDLIPVVLVESPVLLPSVRVGVLDILERFEKKGKCRYYYKSTFTITKKDLTTCDILISVRGCETMSLEIAKVAKKMGRFLIYYLDDDLLNLPESAISYEYYQRKSVRNNIKELIGISDLFWSNNKKIIEKYSKFSKKKRYVRTDIIANLSIKDKKGKQDVIRILYAGSIDHTYLVEKYVLPAIKKIVEEYSGRVEAVLIGVEPRQYNSKGIKVYKFIDNYDDYRRIVKDGNYDIGLGIIGKTDFYQCKYYNKFLEYATMGVAGIYTDVFPYTAVVQNRENGVLVDNTVESWYDGIRLLVENTELREHIALQAQENAREQFCEQKIISSVEKMIPEFWNFKAEVRNDLWKIHLKNGRIVYMKQRLLDFWREDKMRFLPNVVVAGIGVIVRYVKQKKYI